MVENYFKEYDDIINWVPDAIIDLRYQTTNNFMKEGLYKIEYSKLRIGTLKKLQAAANILRKKNYRIKVWDAYRPMEVQKLFWEKVMDSRYVAEPSKGSKHNRGCAIDLTLTDLDGKELEMPSDFDDFSNKASSNLEKLDGRVKKHLSDLQEAMIFAGFETDLNEWWHFSDMDWESYELE